MQESRERGISKTLSSEGKTVSDHPKRWSFFLEHNTTLSPHSLRVDSAIPEASKWLRTECNIGIVALFILKNSWQDAKEEVVESKVDI